jgi:hypothetical protein
MEQKMEKDMLWFACRHHAGSSSSSGAWAFDWARYRPTNFQKIKKCLEDKQILKLMLLL